MVSYVGKQVGVRAEEYLRYDWRSIRHRSRGVMIYWHLEKKSVRVYSQLKSVSSSEVAAMIEGVLRHCTDMLIEKSFTDSHGASEIAFAFSHLLGFELLPRLKPLASQKLYRPDRGKGPRARVGARSRKVATTL